MWFRGRAIRASTGTRARSRIAGAGYGARSDAGCSLDGRALGRGARVRRLGLDEGGRGDYCSIKIGRPRSSSGAARDALGETPRDLGALADSSRSLSNKPLQQPTAEGGNGPRVDLHSAPGRPVPSSRSAVAAERQIVRQTRHRLSREGTLAMETDSAHNPYWKIGNLRITYVCAQNRPKEKNWTADADAIRVQAYRDGESESLHMGAEFPVGSPSEFVELVECLCRAYREGRGVASARASALGAAK